MHNSYLYGKAHKVCLVPLGEGLSHIFTHHIFCFQTLSFGEDGVESKTKTKLICHYNTELIPPLSINLLIQELHALSQVANKLEVISSWMPCQSCVMKTHCIKLSYPSLAQMETSQLRTPLTEAILKLILHSQLIRTMYCSMSVSN